MTLKRFTQPFLGTKVAVRKSLTLNTHFIEYLNIYSKPLVENVNETRKKNFFFFQVTFLVSQFAKSTSVDLLHYCNVCIKLQVRENFCSARLHFICINTQITTLLLQKKRRTWLVLYENSSLPRKPSESKRTKEKCEVSSLFFPRLLYVLYIYSWSRSNSSAWRVLYIRLPSPFYV